MYTCYTYSAYYNSLVWSTLPASLPTPILPITHFTHPPFLPGMPEGPGRKGEWVK